MFILLNLSIVQCPTSPGSLQGCQQRNIICEEFLLNDYLWPGTRVNDSVCENLGLTRPHSVRSCQGFSCNFGVWMVGRGDVSISMNPSSFTFHNNICSLGLASVNVVSVCVCVCV